MRTRPSRAAVFELLVVVLSLAYVFPAAGISGFGSRTWVSASTPPATWSTYHHDTLRSGYDAQQPAFTSIQTGWTAPTTVDGAVYAEPLVVGNTVVVATENNSVYALNAATGSMLWRANLGPPVSGSSLPCGNISTVGITSTPVIDTSAGIIYVAALVQPSGQSMRHELAAITLATGAIRYQETITVSGLDPQHHLQRGALTLLGGTVYIPFGGNYGDCTPYHGWLIGAPASGSGSFTVFKSSNDSGGALWQPAGASVDASGNLYETTGNTFCSGSCAYDGGETVVKLSPSLQELDYFAPSDWSSQNANDLDLGSTNPLLVNGGLVFQVGKPGDGFLLKQSALGHIGGQAFMAHVCPNLTSDAAFGGDAYVDPYIYVPCSDHLVALTLNSNAPSFAFAWQGPSVSFAGPPVVAGGLVWTLDPQGTLYALNPTSGATVYQHTVGAAEHFATPSAGDGAVFVAAGTKVYAFVSGTSATPTPSPTATMLPAPSPTPSPTGSPAPSPTPLRMPGIQLFADAFAQDAIGTTPAGWSVSAQTPSGVHFLVAAGNGSSHVVAHSGWGGKLVIDSSGGWTNASTIVQVQTAGWGSSAQEGIAVRLQSYSHYLRLVLVGTTTLELDAIDGGTLIMLASVPFASAGGVWYTLRLDAIDNTLTGYINGTEMLTTTMPSGYASGQIGIDSNTPAQYTNVTIYAAANGPALH
ncbi:MAG: PQQ-binding-like beta-propeller repeat protein [Ktedonobacterales bacterium]